MIYLVSRQSFLFSSSRYTVISFSAALAILEPIKLVQCDTETSGLDCHTKKLLTIQLGNRKSQIVFDWTTLTDSEKHQLKIYLEDLDRTLLGWNLMFDLGFLYKENIWPKKIWDGMLADQLIFLGYPRVLAVDVYDKLNLPFYAPVYDEKTGALKHYELSYSLKAAAKRWCNIDIDKTVRGDIITKGLTEETVEYAGLDVKWLEDIKDEQDKEIAKQHLEKAVVFECAFARALAYTKFCGIHLSYEKWSEKMKNDLERLNKARKALDTWTINYIKTEHPELSSKYIFVDRQGDLWNGFNLEPQCTINWDSSTQVIPLFELIGVHVTTFDKATKMKKKSVDKKVLKPQKNDFEIVALFLEFQAASKVVSTYGDNWLKAINPVTGRVHLEFHSIGTDTSRVSSGGGVYKLNAQLGA